MEKKRIAKEKVYVVVEVYHGVASDAWAYRDPDKAEKKAERVWKGLNEDEDDVKIFILTVN